MTTWGQNSVENANVISRKALKRTVGILIFTFEM